MVVILATLVVEPRSRAAFEAAAAQACADTAGSTGCLRYEFSRDLRDPDTFHISEVWADETAFESHVASAHHAEFRAALAGCTVIERRIDRYEATRRTRLG